MAAKIATVADLARAHKLCSEAIADPLVASLRSHYHSERAFFMGSTDEDITEAKYQQAIAEALAAISA
jgi:hypothetical protein